MSSPQPFVDSSQPTPIKIDSDLEIRFLLYTLCGCIVLVVSSMTAIVFTFTKEFRTKYALFNALAYADFINGLSFVMAGVFRSRYMHQGEYFITVTNSQCIWGTPWAVLMIVAGQIPAFLNLSLSLERVVALKFSSWYRRVWREHFKHYLVIASISITGVLFIGVLFLDRVHTVVNANRICAVMNSTGIVFGTIHYSACALIFLACFIMLVCIFNKTNKRKKPSKDEHRRQMMLKYLTLVSVVLVSIPNLILILNEWKLPAMNALLVGIIYCMYAMHSAMSLPIYLFFRPDFRARFVQLFFRRESKQMSDPMTVTVGVKQAPTVSTVSSVRMTARRMSYVHSKK